MYFTTVNLIFIILILFILYFINSIFIIICESYFCNGKLFLNNKTKKFGLKKNCF